MGYDLYNNMLESALSQHANKPLRGDNILNLTFSTNDGQVSNAQNLAPMIIKLFFLNINLEV